MPDRSVHIERMLDRTITAVERLEAQRDAWQVLQLLRLGPDERDRREARTLRAPATVVA